MSSETDESDTAQVNNENEPEILELEGLEDNHLKFKVFQEFFFVSLENLAKTVAKCKICGALVKYGEKSSSNLKRHLQVSTMKVLF
jgi:hypothetical protein